MINGEIKITPLSSEEIALGAVRLPSGIAEYGNTSSLLKQIEPIYIVTLISQIASVSLLRTISCYTGYMTDSIRFPISDLLVIPAVENPGL